MAWWTKVSQRRLQERVGVPELRAELHQATLRLKQLEEALLALQDAHERLRGRYYATRGPETPPQPESKAEILKRMGFMR